MASSSSETLTKPTTLEEVIASKEYKEGWDVYDVFYKNGHKWPAGMGGKDSECPYGETGFSSAMWYAGANSAYGIDYLLYGPLDGFGQLKARTEPSGYHRRQPVQLSLFED